MSSMRTWIKMRNEIKIAAIFALVFLVGACFVIAQDGQEENAGEEVNAEPAEPKVEYYSAPEGDWKIEKSPDYDYGIRFSFRPAGSEEYEEYPVQTYYDELVGGTYYVPVKSGDDTQHFYFGHGTFDETNIVAYDSTDGPLPERKIPGTEEPSLGGPLTNKVDTTPNEPNVKPAAGEVNQGDEPKPASKWGAAITGEYFTLYGIDESGKTTSQQAPIPIYLLGGFERDPKTGNLKTAIDPSKVPGLLNNLEISEDGKTVTFEVDRKAARQIGLDRGKWTIEVGEDGERKYSRGSSLRFTEYVTGGGFVVDKRTGTQSIKDAEGNEIYYCNPWLTFGICDALEPCNPPDKTQNCFHTGEGAEDKPIIMTGCDEDDSVCKEEKKLGSMNFTGFGDFFTEDRCFVNGQTYSYNKQSGDCSSVFKDRNAVAEMSIVDPTTGEEIIASYDTETNTFKCGSKDAEGKLTYGDCNDENKTFLKNRERQIDIEVFSKRFELGLNKGLGAAGTVGTFVNLGKSYGWWELDDSFLWYQSMFENSVLLRAMSEPERLICEQSVDYDDLLNEGFLPTTLGYAGADIQAERIKQTIISTTTLEEKEIQYYKVTFNVNGQAILEPVTAQTMEGEYLEKRETEIQVFLENGGSQNVTGAVDICVGDCDDDEYSSYGTTSMGRPIVYESDKHFSKACIKFSNRDDLDPYVKDYLSENDNKVCNDIEVVNAPIINVQALEGSDEE